MKRIIILFSIIFASASLHAQDKIAYILNSTANTDKVFIEIYFDSIPAKDVKLVIPRSAPGTYSLTNYLPFVDGVVGYTSQNDRLTGEVGDGSYFFFDGKEFLKKVSYTVDVKKMESDLLDASMSSKSRNDYLGLFGYSVFGFIEGLENYAIDLTINTDTTWSIFTTLSPDTNRKNGTDHYKVENFAVLADAQYLLGNAVQVIQMEKADIPFFVAAYCETTIDMDSLGNTGLLALKKLADYFEYIPMPHYTLVYEFLQPVSERHDYGFNMEHFNSMTAHRDITREYNVTGDLGTIIHHMGHSWVPLRSWGEGYRPSSWQIAPLIETIWLNEGFIWYISYYCILKNERIVNRWKSIMENAPDFIKNKNLKELSLLGSTQYSSDFRIGKNLFSRGALMAHEMDGYLRKETKGTKSFKDAILGLLAWSKTHQKAFKYDEIVSIMSQATSTDLSSIWNKWQRLPE